MLLIELVELDNNFTNPIYLAGKPMFSIESSDLKNNHKRTNYISFDGLGIDLNDNNKSFYNDEFPGFISSTVSNSNFDDSVYGYSLNQEFGFTILTTNGPLPKYITLCFSGHCCSFINIAYRYQAVTIKNEYYKIDTDKFCIPITEIIENVVPSGITVSFLSTPLPHQLIKLQSVTIGKITNLNKIKSCELLEEINVLSDDLPINSLKFSAAFPENFQFKENSIFNAYSNEKYYGTFYLEDEEKIAKDVYQITALNCIKKINDIQYKDWIVGDKSITFFEEVENLSGIECKTNHTAAYRVFGHIPINTLRYALCQFAFACRLIVDSSRNQSILLKKIPEQVTSVILTESKRIIGNATFIKSKPITTSKFQYADIFKNQDNVIELKVTPNQRTLYYFDEPVEVLENQPDYITVYSSSSNYIDFISTQENPALNVYKITYFYKNIDIINNLDNNAPKNEKDFSKLNLRGGTYNSLAITQLPEFKIEDIKKYMQSRGVVKAKIILQNEKVGDLIQIETAFDGIKTGIITSMAISFGYRDVAEIEVLEWPIGMN